MLFIHKGIKKKSFGRFITGVLAIVGGVYMVARLTDRVVYTVDQRIFISSISLKFIFILRQ